MRKQVILKLAADAFMTDRLRDGRGCQTCRHFDTSQGTLYPYARLVADTTAQSGLYQAFSVGSRTAGGTTTNGVVFAIGKSTNNTIHFTADASGDAPTWADPASNATSNGNALLYNTFFYYKNYTYIFNSTNSYLMRFGDWTGTPAWTENYQTGVTSAVDVPPVHHKQDDCAYFFGSNIVYRLNNTTWDGAVLTLPDSHKIAGACEYGAYLAIAMQSKTAILPNFIAIWDRSSSLNTLSQKIQCGWGNMMALGVVKGALVVVQSDASGSYTGYRPRLSAKVLEGNYFREVYTVTGSIPIAAIVPYSYSDGNFLYFLGGIEQPSDGQSTHNFSGLWRVSPNGATDIMIYDSSLLTPDRFFVLGNKVALFDAAGTVVKYTTNQTYTTDFSLTSIYETRIFNEGDPTTTKKLVGVTVAFEPLLSSGSVSLYYRVPGTATWTLLKTESTDGATRLRTITSLPQYKEIQFRIESTGKAIITDMRYAFDVISDDIY